MAASSMSVAFTKAFDAWETEFRAHPERFMTVEQVAALAVLPLAEQRTVTFEAILNTLSAGGPWDTIGQPQTHDETASPSPRLPSREAAARARAEDSR